MVKKRHFTYKNSHPHQKFEGVGDSVERLSMAVHKNAKAPDNGAFAVIGARSCRAPSGYA